MAVILEESKSYAKTGSDINHICLSIVKVRQNWTSHLSPLFAFSKRSAKTGQGIGHASLGRNLRPRASFARPSRWLHLNLCQNWKTWNHVNKQMLLPKNRLSPITAVILQKYLKKPLEHFYDIKYVCLRRGVIPSTGDDAIWTLAGNCKNSEANPGWFPNPPKQRSAKTGPDIWNCKKLEANPG